MSEPSSYALHVAVQPDRLRDWLAAPCPAPNTWQDWENLNIPRLPGVFDTARRASGNPIGALLAELVSPAPECWHFVWADGRLSLVALQGSENWAVHLLFLTAFRTLGQFGAGPGAAVSHGYVWREGITDWGVLFNESGDNQVTEELPSDVKAELDAMVLPLVDAARAGEAGPARDEFDTWWPG